MHARWQSIGGVGCGGWFSREVWVFPTLAGASEVASRVERSWGMLLLCAGRLLGELCGCVQESRAAAFFWCGWISRTFFLRCGEDGSAPYDWERRDFLAGDRHMCRSIWSGRDRLWLGRYGLGEALGRKRPSTKSVPGLDFPVALFSGNNAGVSLSESSKSMHIVHHDLLLSSSAFFSSGVRISETPSTSSREGRLVSDADMEDVAGVASEKEVLVRKARASLSRQIRPSTTPSVASVVDVTGVGGVKVRAQQRLVLTEAHMSVTDAETVLPVGGVDPCKDHVSYRPCRRRNTTASFVFECLGGDDAGDKYGVACMMHPCRPRNWEDSLPGRRWIAGRRWCTGQLQGPGCERWHPWRFKQLPTPEQHRPP